jgi:two-component system, cell cycle sensor histidine kinase and response regulator CckA
MLNQVVAIAGKDIWLDFSAKWSVVGAMNDHSTICRENEQFRLLVEGVEDCAIYLLDVDGKVVSWNPGAERIKQYSSDEIIGQNYSRFFSEEDQLAGKPQLALQIAEYEGRFSEEGWRIRKDGSRFWASVVLTALRDSGELVGFAKVTRDCTERKIAEHRDRQVQQQLEARVAERTVELAKLKEELRNNEECYRTIVDAVSAVIWRWDLSTGTYTSVPSWSQFTGLPPEAVAGLNWVKPLHPDDRGTVLKLFMDSLSNQGQLATEYRAMRFDGNYRHISMRGMPLIAADGVVREWVGICVDITQQKFLEEQLRHSQKMEAVGQLAGGIAHDFNNLLTVILSYGELLLDSKVSDRDREMIGAIVDSASRASALTRQLLAFSRRSILELREIDVNSVVLDTEYILRRLIGEKIAVNICLDPSVCKIRADAGQLGQVLINLVVNARDAMPRGGQLTIATKNVQFDEHYVNTNIQVDPGQYVLLMVSDSGTGMLPEIRSKIFEPFFTTKPSGHGTGLGLAVVRGIVEQLNGRIGVYSEPGLGTVVKLYLPIVVQQLPLMSEVYN